MDIFALIFVVFFIFVVLSMCGFCCKKTEQGAVFSTPVVVTSATHQPPGGPTYPIQTEHTTIITSSPPQQPVGMPMPYNQPSAIPYPPVAAPGFGVAPYPPSNPSAGYPPSAPYPTMNPNMNPPSYNEVMGSSQPPQPGAINTDFYQKQSPYNPNYTG